MTRLSFRFAIIATLLFAMNAGAAAFTPGNIVVYRVGDGAATVGSTGTAVFVDEYTPAGTFVQSIGLPTAVSGANKRLVASGTSTSEGLLTLSADGQYLVFAGYDAAVGATVAGSTSAAVNRVIGRIGMSGTVDTSTALNDAATASSPRGATSTNGTDLWIAGGAGGVRYTTLGSTTSTQLSTTVTNLRGANIFNNQLYVSSMSGAFRLASVGTGTPSTSGQVITNLTGFPTAGNSSPYQFVFFDLSAAVAGLDTVYVADDATVANGGGVQKWTFDGTTWTKVGTVTLGTLTARGITGSVSGSTVTLFATSTGTSLTSANSVYQIIDSGSGMGTPAIVATSGANTIFRGIARIPAGGGGSTNPTGTGNANPNTVVAGGSTLLTVAVTPGTNPTSTGLTVAADLSAIGGSASQQFLDDGLNGDVTGGDNIFSYAAVVSAATSPGVKNMPASIDDAQSRHGSATITLTVPTPTNPSGVGASNPSSVAAGEASLLTVTVTPGTNPTSTGITVSVDLFAIGGPIQTFYDDGTHGDVTAGDNIFSYNATVANGTSNGLKSMPGSVTDAQARGSATMVTLTVQDAGAPAAPTNLTAVGGNAQVSLSWTASANATGYNVKRGTFSGGPYDTTVATGVPVPSYLDTTVTNGTQYYYVVTATNGGGESGPSNEATATPAAPIGKVYFIDIGQGASTLIVSPTGKSLLVDGGPTGQGNSKIVPLLNTLGINTIDFTVLTHYHIDHDDGLLEVINAGKVAGTAYDNGDTPALTPPGVGGGPTSTWGTYIRYINALSSHAGTITRVRPEDVGGSLAGTVIDLGGGMKATIVAQGGKLLSGGQITISNDDLNTESISVLVEYNNFDFLVSGDLTGGGSTSTARTPDVETFVGQMVGDIDVFEYDHHGSTTANNARFIKLLKAEIAVAECGFTNTFGHPNRETINKYLNIPVTSGNTFGGTGIPTPPGNGPVSYQTDPSPATDDRVSRQGYSGASPANAGNGTLLLATDGTTSFEMESFEDAGVRIDPSTHTYALDATGSGVTTNFAPTVIPTFTPEVPLATDTVTVNALVNDREDPITGVTLNYSLNGAAQAPVPMSFSGGVYVATIAAQPDATRVDLTVTATAGGKTTSYSTGYFAGTTPIANLRVLDALGEPMYLDYAARIAGTSTTDTGTFSAGTNDDYVQDATGGINVWRTIEPSVPAVQTMTTNGTYTVAGRIGELAGRFHLETTPPFESPTTPYQITPTGSSTVTPALKTIAQLNAAPESFEAQLVQINNCTVPPGSFPAAGAPLDTFVTVSDGSGSFQLKIDKDTNIPGMATPSSTFTIVGIIQQDDFLRPFDTGYDIAPRNRVDLGGAPDTGPTLITIAAARAESGPNYVPTLLGQTVKVRGVVTSINFRTSNGSGIEYYIQDSTAGVDIFATAQTRTFAIGDNLEVIGAVSQFNGLTEINPGATLSNVTVLPVDTLPAVSPTTLTLADVGNAGAGEAHEGSRIRVNYITLVSPPATWVGGTNYAINGTPAAIRISASSNLVGQPAPAGTFSVLGELGQFDSASPFDSGYQIFPNSTSDIIPTVAAIEATSGTPQSAAVNTAFNALLRATVRDANGVPVSGVQVTFIPPASGASGTFAGLNTVYQGLTDANGVVNTSTFTANAVTGTYNVIASASGYTSANFTLTNLPASATHFTIALPATVTSNVGFDVTVTARDSANNIVPTYTGTVHFTSTDAFATLPGDYTFTAGDAGVHTFTQVTLATAGSQSITATDTVTASITGTGSTTVECPATTVTATNDGPVCAGATLQLDVTEVVGATYSWTGPNSYAASVRNPSIVSIGAEATGTYSVTVTKNGCTFDSSTNVTVNPVPSAPTASNDGPYVTGDDIHLFANDVTGAAYQWTGPNGFTSNVQNPTILNAQLANAGTYSVTVSLNNCPSAAGTTNVVVTQFTPAAPTDVTATGNGDVNGTVTVTWSASAGATSYTILRRGIGELFGPVGTVTMPFPNPLSFLDLTSSPNTAYLYEVVASHGTGNDSPPSAFDLAVTVPFGPDLLSDGTVLIRVDHMYKLRAAVTKVSELAGLSDPSYTDAVLDNVKVKKVHITELRDALDAARNAFGFAPLSYSNIDQNVTPIGAAQFMQLRNAIR